MAFHEIRFPDNISRGAKGGPERRTQVVTLASGDEERNASWANSRRHYDAAYGIRRADDLAAVIAFFEARNGRLFGFRWKDWADYKSCLPSGSPTPFDQRIAVADGTATQFPLQKTYMSGAQSWARRITKPVAGTVHLGVDQPQGPELVPFWDSPRTSPGYLTPGWLNTTLFSANSANTYGAFTNATDLSTSNGGLRQAAAASVVPGRTYRASVWFKNLTGATGHTLNARLQPGNLDSKISGPTATPTATGAAGGPISNVTSTDFGGGVWRWTFDLTVGAGFTDLQLGFGFIVGEGSGTATLFAGSLYEPQRVLEVTGWTVDATTGIVTFPGPPSAGTILTAGFEFDVPVRFDTDDLPVTLDIERLGSITSIPLIEVRR